MPAYEGFSWKKFLLKSDPRLLRRYFHNNDAFKDVTFRKKPESYLREVPAIWLRLAGIGSSRSDHVEHERLKWRVFVPHALAMEEVSTLILAYINRKQPEILASLEELRSYNLGLTLATKHLAMCETVIRSELRPAHWHHSPLWRSKPLYPGPRVFLEQWRGEFIRDVYASLGELCRLPEGLAVAAVVNRLVEGLIKDRLCESPELRKFLTVLADIIEGKESPLRANSRPAMLTQFNRLMRDTALVFKLEGGELNAYFFGARVKKLGEKGTCVLVALAKALLDKSHDNTVTKEELISQCWPDSITEWELAQDPDDRRRLRVLNSILHNGISEIRKALRKAAEGNTKLPQVTDKWPIENVRKVGWRLVLFSEQVLLPELNASRLPKVNE